MNRLTTSITIVSVVTLLFYACFKAGWLVLPGYSTESAPSSGAATDGIVAIAVLVLLVIVLPLLFHFHLLFNSKRNGNAKQTPSE